MELECAINALATGNKTLRLIVATAPARPARRWFDHHQRVQPQPRPQAQAQPSQPAQATEPLSQQVFEFLKSWGCPASEKTYQLIVTKINEFVKRVPDFKSADQFITEVIAEAEKLLANEDLKAILPFPIRPENIREFVAPFLENPFVQQTITTFYEKFKQAAQQQAQQPATEQPAQPHAHPHPHSCPRFRHHFFNPGNGNPNEEIHFGVVCDGCQLFPLRGTRHRCTQCPDYDLCQSCLDKGIHKDTAHVFVQVPPHPRPQFPPHGFFGRCGRRRGIFQQQQQPQQPAAEQPPVKAEEPVVPEPEVIVAVSEPVVITPEPVKVEEPQQQQQPEQPVEEVITPEEVVSLEKLASMGFFNKEANLTALRTAGGDLWEALQIILQQ
eukprot:TRINITY_DN365_c0_g2_i3.p1 TRINITY_DN365_c0_g2~~TRINITY_DN365_c0_g2_i3.p1  ORF type:complete len:384 (-),score=117.87 TRINITY_DN365_c0_g2_i3:97-1248(-)